MNDTVFLAAAITAGLLWAGVAIGLAEHRYGLAAVSFALMFPAGAVITLVDAALNPELPEVPAGLAICGGWLMLPVALIVVLLVIRWLTTTPQPKAEKLPEPWIPESAVPNHPEMLVQSAAALANQRHSGRNRGAVVHVYYTMSGHENRISGQWLERNGPEVGVIPHCVSTKKLDEIYRGKL